MYDFSSVSIVSIVSLLVNRIRAVRDRYDGLRARHSNELPNGASNRRIHALSISSNLVNIALIGAAGTVISPCAPSSGLRPRQRCSVRATTSGRNSTVFVYVSLTIENPAPARDKRSIDRV